MAKTNNAAGDQAKRMQQEADRQARERAKLERENQQKADANKRRRMGRASLITTSELGVGDTLG